MAVASSSQARICRQCRLGPVAHENINRLTGRPGVIADGRCPGYEPQGDPGVDMYYCGCRGFD